MIIKALIIFSLTVGATLSSFGQIFTPSNVRAGAIGAGIGAIIGHQSDRTGKGALIGGAAGILLSNLHENRGTSIRNYNGAITGGLIGGVIGHQSNRAWQGAAIGTAAGYILHDSVQARQSRYNSNFNRRYYNTRTNYPTSQPTYHYIGQPTYYSQPSRYAQPSYPSQAPTNITIINNYYGNSGGSAMSSANSLFGR